MHAQVSAVTLHCPFICLHGCVSCTFAACQIVTARKFVCSWPVLLYKDVRVVQVTVTAKTAGFYTNTAFVKTTSKETNPNNNRDSDTLEVKVGGFRSYSDQWFIFR
jgi:hypothetical protein